MWMKQWKEPKVRIQLDIREIYIYQSVPKMLERIYIYIYIYMQSYKVIFYF
jgi:hypothetical protein